MVYDDNIRANKSAKYLKINPELSSAKNSNMQYKGHYSTLYCNNGA